MTAPITLQPAYSADLVPMLTELLRRAQAGEVSQAAVVALAPDGIRYSTWVSGRAPDANHGTLALIGGVADLQFELLQLHNQQQG